MQAIAGWLAGIHLGPHVSGKLDNAEMNRRKALESNWTFLLNTAIGNLHKCLWFGIFEDMDKSLEMFRYQTGLQLNMMHFNKGHSPTLKLTTEQIHFLKQLIPIDMYLYEYARQLHEHKWKMFKLQKTDSLSRKNMHVHFNLPTVLNGCRSTPDSLSCPKESTEMKPFVENFKKFINKKLL